MAVTDYNRKKDLEVTSQNDSGATVDKAQPVLIKGETTGGDTASTSTESAESGAATIIYDIELKVKGIVSTVGVELDDEFNSSTQTVTYSVEDDSTNELLAEKTITLDPGEFGTITFTESDYSRVPNAEDRIRLTTDTWAAATSTYTEVSNDLYQIFDDGGMQFPGERTSSGGTALEVTEVAEDESDTGTGDIILDWTNISSESDIAVYDQDGNLLDYEIESLDTTAETATLWCYNSWVRDDTVQAQVVYGNGPASSEENVIGTWNNTGQNAVMVQHLQDDPLTATDSTSNNNDGTVNGAVSTSGMFDGAGSFDGTDDYISIPDSSSLNPSDITIVGWANLDSTTPDNSGMVTQRTNSGNSSWGVHFDNGQYESDFHDGSNTTSLGASIPDTDWNHVVSRYEANASASMLVNATQQDSASAGGGLRDLDREVWIGAFFESDRVVSGILDEIRVYSEYKSDAWTQADYDASPKAGQVFFSQSAAEDTAQTITDTAVKSSATTSTITATETADYLETATKSTVTTIPQTSTELVTVIESVTKTAATTTTLASTEISSVTDTAVKSAATTSPLTSQETADYLDTAVKSSATATTLTSTETEVLIEIATKSSANTTSLTSTETVTTLDTDTAVKSSATATSLTSIETMIMADTAIKTISTTTPLTSSEFASTTDTATKSTATATPLTSDTTFDAVATAVKSSATVITLASEEIIVNADEAVKTQVTATSLTATETDIIQGFQIFLNTEATTLLNVENEAK